MTTWVIEVRTRKSKRAKWGKWHPDDLCVTRQQDAMPTTPLQVLIGERYTKERRWTQYKRIHPPAAACSRAGD